MQSEKAQIFLFKLERREASLSRHLTKKLFISARGEVHAKLHSPMMHMVIAWKEQVLIWQV